MPYITQQRRELLDKLGADAVKAARALNVNISRAVVLKHFFNTTRPHRHGGKRS